MKKGLLIFVVLLGFVFGLLRGGVFVLLMIMAGVAAAMTHQPSWQQSKLIPYCMPMIESIHTLIPSSLHDYMSSAKLHLPRRADKAHADL